MKKFIERIWRNLGEGWQAVIFILGFIAILFILSGCIMHITNNRIEVYPTTHLYSDNGKEMVNPVILVGEIYYGGHPIVEESFVVEFCDVKAARKSLKKELKIVRKDLRKTCKKPKL